MPASPPATEKLSPAYMAIAAIATLGLVAGIGFAGLRLAGITGTPDASTGVELPVDDTPSAVQLASSPAADILSATLESAPADWNRTSAPRADTSIPFPYSCPQDRTSPAITRAQDYTNGAGRFQVTLTAYPAGSGAPAYQRLTGGVNTCKLDTDRVSTTRTTLGAESNSVTVTRGGGQTTVHSIRRGDVIAYISGSDRPLTDSIAVAVDTLLAGALTPACINQGSVTADSSRAPQTGTAYVPATETRTVTAKNLNLPKVPATADYETVDLTAPVPNSTPITPRTAPEYPVWPAMPAPLTAPATVTAPVAAAPGNVMVDVPVDDVDGPGCGWAFTGMSKLLFDADAAEKTTDDLLDGAKRSADSAVSVWRGEVLRFWSSYEKHTAAVEAYRVYSEQVAAVSAAWAVIDGQWTTYRANVVVYDQQVAARESFLASQRAAQTEYDSAVTACEASKASPAPTPAPSVPASPAPSPSASPAPTVAPSPSLVPAEPCTSTVERPGVLDESAPTVGAVPVQPVDPRPKA